jgi:shikimate dehydrogenase
VINHRVPWVITSVGSPGNVVERVHAYGGQVLADVATVRHARKAIAAGVDMLVLLTAGAGGNTGWINPFAFIEEVRGFWSGPLAVAGCLTTGRQVRAIQVAGADMAYMGTPFIATPESMASPAYKEALASAGADDIVKTDAVTGIPANFLKSSLLAQGIMQADGSLHGFNHDGFGYIQSLKDVNPHWRADAGPIVVLGAGGAARAVLISLIDEGAQEIRLINRTRDKADELASVNPQVVKTYTWDERHTALEGAAMLVNTTNQGMYDQPPLDIRLDALPTSAMVSDLVYIPLETPLLAAARARGHVTVNGLGMLLNQAIPAFESWFGVRPVVTDELRQSILATF